LFVTAVFEPVAFAVHLENVNVMVNQSSRFVLTKPSGASWPERSVLVVAFDREVRAIFMDLCFGNLAVE
jgi:hypothetical protein